MKIARCTPSRGLVHSRTEEAAELVRLWAEANRYQWRSFWSHNLPIPDCFNDVCTRAYDWGADLIWILEEDVQPEPDAFPAMVEQLTFGADVAVVDYTMETCYSGEVTWGVMRDGAGRIAWVRTGCILLKRECLEALPQPWFTLYGRLFRGGRTVWRGVGPCSTYGADVLFTHNLVQLGFAIVEVEAQCNHLRVVERGQAGVNEGWHKIEPIPLAPKPPLTPPRRKHNGSIGRQRRNGGSGDLEQRDSVVVGQLVDTQQVG